AISTIRTAALPERAAMWLRFSYQLLKVLVLAVMILSLTTWLIRSSSGMALAPRSIRTTISWLILLPYRALHTPGTGAIVFPPLPQAVRLPTSTMLWDEGRASFPAVRRYHTCTMAPHRYRWDR